MAVKICQANLKVFRFYCTMLYLLSVMQSDRNSFCVHALLDRVNMAFRDKINILDQIYGSEDVRIFY